MAIEIAADPRIAHESRKVAGGGYEIEHRITSISRSMRAICSAVRPRTFFGRSIFRSNVNTAVSTDLSLSNSATSGQTPLPGFGCRAGVCTRKPRRALAGRCDRRRGPDRRRISVSARFEHRGDGERESGAACAAGQRSKVETQIACRKLRYDLASRYTNGNVAPAQWRVVRCSPVATVVPTS